VREARVRDREDTETDKDTERDKDRERQIDIIWEGEETADTRVCVRVCVHLFSDS